MAELNMPATWIVVSNYCDTRLDNNEYSKEEAKRIAKIETNKAFELGFEEIRFSAIPIPPIPEETALTQTLN